MAKPQVNVAPIALTPTNVVTGCVRLAFQSLLEPRVNMNDDGTPGKAKYVAVLLIEPTDTALLGMMKAAMKAAAVDFFGEGKVPSGMRNPIRDGNEKAGEYSFYKDKLFISCNSDKKPGLLNQAAQLIVNEDDIYSGCWVRADINCAGYDRKGNKGVSFFLNNVQKLGDDERFGGRRSAESVFSPVVDAANPFGGEATGAADDMFA